MTSIKKERAILVGVTVNGNVWETEDHLQELALLADTAGAEVVETIQQERRRIDPAYFIGKGKAKILAQTAREKKANLFVFDDDLSPAQLRNLEKVTETKILDRSGLILDIFARRAQTKEARTQVELAQLNYLLPRLARQWTHLSRQVGGIGTRGPGETQLETDRRLIRQRISSLTKTLEKIKSQRLVRRQGRQDSYKAALVGYTNAGKSTLLNALTQSDVFVEDRLFATLDPTIRRLSIADFKELLLIDTVGFIRKLPHNLVASFMSTLEEATVADFLLHVIDVTHPHLKEHISVVDEVLKQLKIDKKPRLFVFNKIDKLEQKALIRGLEETYQPSVFVSACRGLFLGDLKRQIRKLAIESIVEIELGLPLNSAALVAKLHEFTDVMETDYADKRVTIRIRTNQKGLARINRLLGKEVPGEFKLAKVA